MQRDRRLLIMSWTEAQMRRLDKEHEILNKYFPEKVSWINRRNNDTKFEIEMTTNSGNLYTLRASIPHDYPNSCPNLYVSNQGRPLKDKFGEDIQCGTENHSYGTRDGLTTICHFVPSMWTNEYTLYQIFMKGRIWLEAYEISLCTGEPMKTYLREMENDIPIEQLFQRFGDSLENAENAGGHEQTRSSCSMM